MRYSRPVKPINYNQAEKIFQGTLQWGALLLGGLLLGDNWYHTAGIWCALYCVMPVIK